MNKTKKTNKALGKSFFNQNEKLFAKLFHLILWPIMEPTISDLDEADLIKLKDRVWQYFLLKIINISDKSSLDVKEFFQKKDDSKRADFIANLIDDFIDSFYEELLESKNKEEIIDSLSQLVNQQIIIMWINQIVENSISPLLIFQVKKSSKIEEIKRILTRVLLAISQEIISSKEASNQISTILKINYELSDEIILFIKSFVKSIANFREKFGIQELVKIGEKSINFSDDFTANNFSRRNLTNIMKDTIYEREKIMNEWKKNILEPATIGLMIAGEKEYEEFITNCLKNFELFLNQTLSAEDFENRLDLDLKKFGGTDEELIEPIKNSIANSIRFLEIARIEDPSLGLLLMIIDEERENTRRSCL